MGYKEISLNLPTDYNDDILKASIGKMLGISDFTYQIENMSLDARQKSNIHWVVRAGVMSAEIQGGERQSVPALVIPYRQRKEKAVVTGSGPAGFFCALVLQKSGIGTTLIERGSEVRKRAESIMKFEGGGSFDARNNYAFGEGGAGTFSDGKLTSRTKYISKERQFILSSYIRAGAPKEINYLAHPHLGSDNLRYIMVNLRKEFLGSGGTLLFETLLEDLKIADGKACTAVTTSDELEADFFVIAPGHSAFETYRMLIRKGVQFRSKPFAIGCRVEHPQEIINEAQWGKKDLPGVKAAEFRLTSKGDDILPVYTFCMCPGGTVVPATAYEGANIVNGMSRYRRDGKFANAACVAAIRLDNLLGRDVGPEESLAWLGNLENSFYDYSRGYAAPFCGIAGFISKKSSSPSAESTYPLGLKPAPLWEMLPAAVSNSLRAGLKDFSHKIKGFESGIILGLESKTSSPIQVMRDKNGLCSGFKNLYIIGEGSGYTGGIISSGSDGIRAALNIIESIH